MSDTPAVSADLDLEPAPPLSPAVEQASQPYIGEWNQLVSTTNWEKGRIITAWRASLVRTAAELGPRIAPTEARES